MNILQNMNVLYRFCPLLKLFYAFWYPGYSIGKIKEINKQNGGFLFGTPGYRVVQHMSNERSVPSR